MVSRQSGLSLVELAVALAIIALTTSLAALSLVALNGYMKVTSTVALLSDTIATTRLDALSRNEYRAVIIPAPQPGTLVVDHVLITRCQANCIVEEAAQWPAVGPPVRAEGMGFVYPDPDDVSHPYEIVFDPIAGAHMRNRDTDIQLCHVYQDAAGVPQCQTNATAKTVRIRWVTGIVHVL